jgi:hypothetical protein
VRLWPPNAPAKNTACERRVNRVDRAAPETPPTMPAAVAKVQVSPPGRVFGTHRISRNSLRGAHGGRNAVENLVCSRGAPEMEIFGMPTLHGFSL